MLLKVEVIVRWAEGDNQKNLVQKCLKVSGDEKRSKLISGGFYFTFLLVIVDLCIFVSCYSMDFSCLFVGYCFYIYLVLRPTYVVKLCILYAWAFRFE